MIQMIVEQNHFQQCIFKQIMGFTGSLQAFLKKIRIGAVNCTPSDCYVCSGVQWCAVIFLIQLSNILSLEIRSYYIISGMDLLRERVWMGAHNPSPSQVGAGGVVFS